MQAIIYFYFPSPILLLRILVVSNLFFCAPCGYSQTAAHPKDELSIKVRNLDISPSSEQSAEPWITLELANSGDTDWYFYANSFYHGLIITVTDSAGKQLPLKEKGKSIAEFKELRYGRRIWRFNSKAKHNLSLGNIVNLSPGSTYSVMVKWTLNVHNFDISKTVEQKRLDPEHTRRVTFEAGPLKVTPKLPN